MKTVELTTHVDRSALECRVHSDVPHPPSIIFIDELDSIGRTRGTGLGGGHDEREQTLNQILAELDGFTAREAVVVGILVKRLEHEETLDADAIKACLDPDDKVTPFVTNRKEV